MDSEKILRQGLEHENRELRAELEQLKKLYRDLDAVAFKALRELEELKKPGPSGRDDYNWHCKSCDWNSILWGEALRHTDETGHKEFDRKE